MTVAFREDHILPLVEGRTVLDCGGVDHDAFALKAARGDWLHALAAERAKSVLGVDILAESVARLNAEGRYRFVAANAEELPFREEFEVVLAGELIEHLHNPGRFLASAWRALVPGGTLILTTPNAHRLSSLLHLLRRGRELIHPEHVSLFSPSALTCLVERHGFRTRDLRLLNRPARRRWMEGARALVAAWRPLLGETILLVADKRDDAAPEMGAPPQADGTSPASAIKKPA